MKYVPSRDIPEFARALKTLSSSAICEMILNKRNVERTPESINMWFKDHPDVKAELEKENIQGLPTEKQAVDDSSFEKEAFESIPSVKEWLLFMTTRRHNGKSLHPTYVERRVMMLRFLCKKYIKHPARLTFHDAQEIFMDLEKEGKDSYGARTVLKDFLKSKGAPEWEKIGVGKPRGFGKFKTLSLEKPIVLAILEWIKTQNFEVYVVDEVMYHKGLRINALVGTGKENPAAMIENFKCGEKWDYLTVTEKFREVKTFKLAKRVGDLIRSVIGERKEGPIFHVIDEDCAKLNREALRRFAPDLEPKIEMPNHCFRHFCAQQTLLYVAEVMQKTGRPVNVSKIVSGIMQCTEQSLNESYGGVSASDIEEWEELILPLMGSEGVPA